MKPRTLAYLSVAVLGLLVALPFVHFGRQAQRLCEWFGGSWSPTNSSCITRSCYASHTCGGRYCPGCLCKGIATGANLADVYVRLGEPGWTKDNRLIWPRGSAESGYVVASVGGGRVTAIDCNVAERPE